MQQEGYGYVAPLKVKIMKKKTISFIIPTVLFLLLTSQISFAQHWDISGDHIFNTNPGRVGIGTQNPAVSLHVFGASQQDFFLDRSYTGTENANLATFRFRHIQTGNQFFQGLRYRNGANDFVQSFFVNEPGPPRWVEYAVFSFSTSNYEMRQGVNHAVFSNSGDFLINSGGSVGVGLSDIPEGVKLAVDGDVVFDGKLTATEIEVKLDVWPDFVFEEDYNLMSLHDLEQYINQNSHLPNVPTEDDVLKNGVNVGEISSILLQKVEELTLYVIELNKQNNELKTRVAELEKR